MFVCVCVCVCACVRYDVFFFFFQTDNKLYLVLDYCPGGELFFHLSRYKRFPEGVVRFYAAELVLALKVCCTCVHVVYLCCCVLKFKV